MIVILKRCCSLLLLASSLLTTSQLFAAQGPISLDTWRELVETASTQEASLFYSALAISDILDPANHECCVAPPPETVEIEFVSDTEIILSHPTDEEHWINTTCSVNEQDLTLTCESETTVAGFMNVNNEFTGTIFSDAIELIATLGVEGELFEQTIEYTLDLILGNLFTDIIDDNIGSPKVVSAAQNTSDQGIIADTNVQFSLKVTRPGSALAIKDAGVSEDVSISTTISPDPGDIGRMADIFIVDWLRPTSFTMRNEDGDFVPWDASLKTLVPHLVDVTLTENLEVSLFEGQLGAAGDHRIFIAFMVDGEGLFLTPSGLRFDVTDNP